MKRYSGIYGELSSITDETTILKIYEQYNGTTITFPKKLYSKGFVQKYICENYGIQSVQEISRYLNLSSRRVMQIAREEGLTRVETNGKSSSRQ